jgi:hypothetical protein
MKYLFFILIFLVVNNAYCAIRKSNQQSNIPVNNKWKGKASKKTTQNQPVKPPSSRNINNNAINTAKQKIAQVKEEKIHRREQQHANQKAHIDKLKNRVNKREEVQNLRMETEISQKSIRINHLYVFFFFIYNSFI